MNDKLESNIKLINSQLLELSKILKDNALILTNEKLIFPSSI